MRQQRVARVLTRYSAAFEEHWIDAAEIAGTVKDVEHWLDEAEIGGTVRDVDGVWVVIAQRNGSSVTNASQGAVW